MKINWKRVEDHKVVTYSSCLVTLEPPTWTASKLAVAFKNDSGEWKIGNGEVCWFEPVYFAYLN